MRVIAILGCAFVAACKNEPSPAPAAPVATASPSATPASSPTTSTGTSASSIPPPSPPPASTSCATDGDCILSTFPGCCSCCECGPLKATTKSMDFAQREACKTKDCPICDNKDYKCIPCKDPTKEGMHARCRDSACILVETSAAAATIACKTDDDCWLDAQRKPIARPANLRGKKIEPCKGGNEHAPACKEGVCTVRAFKC